MGLQPKAAYRDYWALKPKYKNTPWYHEAMKRERFEDIHFTMLPCAETEAQSIKKIQPFLNSAVAKFQSVFYPWQNLSIDEMVIGWKGRSSIVNSILINQKSST